MRKITIFPKVYSYYGDPADKNDRTESFLVKTFYMCPKLIIVKGENTKARWVFIKSKDRDKLDKVLRDKGMVPENFELKHVNFYRYIWKMAYNPSVRLF